MFELLQLIVATIMVIDWLALVICQIIKCGHFESWQILLILILVLIIAAWNECRKEYKRKNDY